VVVEMDLEQAVLVVQVVAVMVQELLVVLALLDKDLQVEQALAVLVLMGQVVVEVLLL
jgi:hypothetical protein